MGIAARALLDAAERGVIDRDDAEAMAREWLQVTGGDLALDVLTDGDEEHLAARLVDLCAHVLRVVEGDAVNRQEKRR